MLFYIILGLVLGSTAQPSTLSELEEKFNILEQKFVTLEQKESNSETKIIAIQSQLEHGGKKYQTLQYTTSTLQLKDHDYLMLQFLGAKVGWLGCHGGGSTCFLATCPSHGNNYRYFDGRCNGEEFQIIGEGTIHDPIKSGQRIRLRYLREHNTWVKYLESKQCGTGTCSGTTAQGSNFNRCPAEMFRIYARGKRNGEVVYNNDVVMLYNDYSHKYVHIEGQKNGDPSNFNFCPGIAPPAYLSYGICSKNVFRIYRKP